MEFGDGQDEIDATDQGERSLFDALPVCIWQADYSAVRARLEEIKASGASDLRSHLAESPDEVRSLAGLVKSVAFNREVVEFLEAADEAEVVPYLPTYHVAESWPVFAEEVVALAEGALRLQAEMSLVTLKGRRREIQYRLAIPKGNEQTWSRVLIAFEDITERKKTEQAPTESERFAHATIDALSATLCVLDETGRIIAVNRAWREFATANGAVPSEVSEGANYLAVCDAVTGPDAREAAAFAAGIRAVASGKREAFSLEYDCHSPTEQRWFVGRVTRFAGPGPVRTVIIHADVTDRRQAEDALRSLQQQLAHTCRLSTAGEMVAGIAHEVNQPLYAIVNYAKACANLLALDEPSKDALRQWTDEIARAAVRAGEIIKRLRDFTRRTETHRLSADVDDVVAASVEMVAFEARRAGVAIQFEFSKADITAVVDRIQVQQVLVNLLRNALEALEATPTEGRRVVVRTAASGPFVEVSVADNGPGLAAHVAAKIFEPFVTTKPNGLGMGLTISRSIVEAHGGRIWTNANPDGGTIFCFSLPMA